MKFYNKLRFEKTMRGNNPVSVGSILFDNGYKATVTKMYADDMWQWNVVATNSHPNIAYDAQLFYNSTDVETYLNEIADIHSPETEYMYNRDDV